MVHLVNNKQFGAIHTEDPKTDGYYIVQFISDPYTLQEDTVEDGVTIANGVLVCDARYFSPVQLGDCWYTLPKDGDIETTVLLRTVIKANLSLHFVTHPNQLPVKLRGLTKEDCQNMLPFLLPDNIHDNILDEKVRREQHEYEYDMSKVEEDTTTCVHHVNDLDDDDWEPLE